MSEFDQRVNKLGRQKAIAFFIPRLIMIAAVILGLYYIFND
jgi:hypothetical protein